MFDRCGLGFIRNQKATMLANQMENAVKSARIYINETVQCPAIKPKKGARRRITEVPD